MPVVAASRIAAQVTSKRSALALCTITRPRTTDAPPKYSPTMAPMRLSVVASLRAVKKYGRAFGIRTFLRIVPSPAAYERMSSNAAGSTWVRPRVTLAITGKKTRTAAIIILDSGASTPNQLLKSGAKAMIGTALAATAMGSSRPRVVAQRDVTNATATPAPVPRTRPPAASKSVAWAEANSGNCGLAQCSWSAAKMADGWGKMNALIESAPTTTSHRTSVPAATATEGREDAGGGE